MVAERNADIGSSFAQLSEQPAKPLALIGCNRSVVRRQLVQDLKIKTARILDELRIGDVFRNLLCFRLIKRDFAAGKSHKLHLVLS